MTISTVTTEAIAGVADLKAGYTLGHADVAILKALAAELLAVREAQSVPVAWKQRFSGDHWQSCNKSMFDYLSENPDPIVEVREVYAAPPAPAVPDEKPFSTPRILAAISDWSNDDWSAVFETFPSIKDKISTALSEQVSNDTRRMDWLVAHHVEVRKPLLYGSEKFFTAQTMTDEEDDYHATSLREQIDAAMAAAPTPTK
ncbi:hypothetical protein [Serratia fonticola]|uniref:hypothetical protein n=1 Tax=Serratia fonticola TaxID=47917 RepID=UPI000685C591|nr:hypothetical protein [Serratia fonticola]